MTDAATTGPRGRTPPPTQGKDPEVEPRRQFAGGNMLALLPITSIINTIIDIAKLHIHSGVTA